MAVKNKASRDDDDADASGSGSARVEQIGVRSVEVAGRLLKTLATLEGPQTLSALSAAADLPPAKAHRYLVSLIREGFVEQNSADGRYDFGGAARLVGRVAMNRLDIMRIGTPLLGELRDLLSETVFMGIWTPRGPVVLECLDMPRPVGIVVRRGALLPVLTSAFGLICAAYLPEHVIDPFVEAELPMQPAAAKRARSELQARLAEIRKSGFSFVQGDLVKGLDAVAVPVLDHRLELVTCVASVGMQGDLDITASGGVVRALKESAQRFSQLLG
jgi:DNA-binding IclR family transcriptional regulator